MDFKNNKKNKFGFTLIEALTVLFIFSLITLTFYSVFSSGSRYIIDAKNRLGAVSLANERMEVVRNLKYSDVGTVDGEVNGNIPQEEDVTENGRTFHVSTLVEYVQDPMDGVFPADVAFEDYKRVTVTVFWNSSSANQGKVTLTSRFVPPGLEVANPGDGILSVNVYSDQPGGTGIPDSNVHIINTDTGLDTDKQTSSGESSLGNATFMGNNIKESIQKYEIEVTKAGYETVRTMPLTGTPEIPKPKFIHASVIAGLLNVAYIAQNKLAEDLKIVTVDHMNQPIADINFHLVGGKELGKDSLDNPVYNMNEDSKTDSHGEKDYGAVSPGPFTITPSLSSSNYKLIGTTPYSPFSLLHDQNTTFKIKLADVNTTSLLVKIVKNEDLALIPLSGAQVEVKNELISYDSTLTTDENGTVFFPTDTTPFQAGTYNLIVKNSGYQDSDSQVTVSNNALKEETITMIAVP
jgi:type II secretory pathway pseudopilin PulG